MTTQEVANALVKLCSEGKLDEAVETPYSPDIASMEGGAPPWQSCEAKRDRCSEAKSEFWRSVSW